VVLVASGFVYYERKIEMGKEKSPKKETKKAPKKAAAATKKAAPKKK